MRRDDQHLALEVEGGEPPARGDRLVEVVAISELQAGLDELQGVVEAVAAEARLLAA
jgi:hypothetical protein